MTLQVTTQPQVKRGTLKIRQSITQMSATDVTRFRKAMQGLVDRHDNRGFQFFAGWHGVPLGICQHHNELFLPWHRGYLYHFELALQEIDAEVTLPWWNWFDEPGIPAAYGDKKVGSKDNILASAPIKPLGIPRRSSWPRRTSRDPGAPVPAGFPEPLGPPLRSSHFSGTQGGAWEWMMGSTSYSEFMQRCWRIHDNIHVWVGGQMTDPNWAAFDPLFWAHHTQVDRLWRVWQHRNPGALPDHHTQETSMTFAKEPALTVRDVLDVKALGYEYAAQAASVGGPN
jgi:tyrosinase